MKPAPGLLYGYWRLIARAKSAPKPSWRAECIRCGARRTIPSRSLGGNCPLCRCEKVMAAIREQGERRRREYESEPKRADAPDLSNPELDRVEGYYWVLVAGQERPNILEWRAYQWKKPGISGATSARFTILEGPLQEPGRWRDGVFVQARARPLAERAAARALLDNLKQDDCDGCMHVSGPDP